MTAPPATSIVIAVKDNPRNLARILEAVSGSSATGAELVFAVAGQTPAALVPLPDNAKIVSAPAETLVRPDVLNHPYAPLLMDVDASDAQAHGLKPFYIAPSLRDDTGPYGNGRYWMPSGRHGGRVNLAFVGGHVLSSEKPEQETWDWEYQAHVGN